MPDISTINSVDIATIASFNGVALADGQTLEGQNVALGGADAHTLISTQTASSSSSLSFTSGIDSTYDVYEWHFINIHPSGSYYSFAFQVNAAGQTGFNETITSTVTWAYHRENGYASSLQYDTGSDQAQQTGYQLLATAQTANPDESASGILRMYAPSDTTNVKHFQSDFNNVYAYDYSSRLMVGGYINTTSAIDEINFKMTGGNIDAGEIRMYGVATS